MDLAAMRAKFYERTSSLAGDFTEGEVDELLNGAYQFTVPTDVAGEFSEALWDLQLEPGQRIYDQVPSLVGLRAGECWIEKIRNASSQIVEHPMNYVRIYTDPLAFRYRHSSPDSRIAGRPTSCLVYGKKIELDRAASDAYLITFRSYLGPMSGLTAEGIDQRNHAMAVVTAAAQEYLTDSEDEAGAVREAAAYARYKGQLLTYAYTRPQERRRKYSF